MAGLLLKTSICGMLALYADSALPSTGQQCGEICESIKAEISSSDACAKSRNSLPRPKIGRVCQEGFDEAFTLTCGELCSLHGTSRATPNHLGEACDKRKREVPRPVAHKACVDGYNAGLSSTTALMTQRILAMGEATRKSFVENNISMLKEANVKHDTSAEIERGREAEQEEQRKEEQERARRAVEERSAQVKREKEALSKKQELETAQAAEQARQERGKAEEKRQARIKAAENAEEQTKHANLADSVAGAGGSPVSTPGQQAGRGANDGAAARHEPLAQRTSGYPEDDPGDGAGLEEDAISRADDSPTVVEGHASDVVGAAELVDVVPAPAGDTARGNAAYADTVQQFVEKTEDEHNQQQSMPTADHVQGSRTPARDGDGANEVGAGDEAAPPTAEMDPSASSEESPAIEQPHHVARYSEVPTAGHVPESLEPPLAPPNNGRPLDLPKGAVTNDNDQDAGENKELLLVKVPDEPRYREVLMAEHVEGFAASMGRRDGDAPREALDGSIAPTGGGRDDAGSEDASIAETQGRVSTE